MPSRAEKPLYFKVEGRVLKLSNLSKPLYPTGFTKKDVIRYYRAIAPALLPHLRGRPLTLKRYPSGVTEDFFFEKRCPSHRPDWIHISKESDIGYCLADDLPTLIWVANLAAIELHPLLAKAPRLKQPTLMVFDLDPGPGADIIDCCDVALELQQILRAHDLRALPKTSGSKGLQLYVPLNTSAAYEQTKHFSRRCAEFLERKIPGRVVSKMAKDLRAGKVFIDWSQNDESKTTVSVYSLRALESPSVSTPLLWDEVVAATRNRDAEALRFTPEQVLERVAHWGDLFAPVQSLRQTCPLNPQAR